MKKLFFSIALIFLLGGCEKKEIKQLHSDIDKLQENQSNFVSRDDLSFETDALEKRIVVLETEHSQTKKELLSFNNKIEKLQQHINDVNNSIKHIKKIYMKNETKIVMSKANVFITKSDTNVYADSQGKKIIMKWKANATFTSYKQTLNFVLVTGYFPHNKWKENTRNWWISKKDIKLKKLISN